MKLNVQGFTRKAQVPVLLASGVLPAVVLAFSYFVNDFVLFAWVLASLYVLLALVGLFIPGKWRVAYGILSAIILLSVGGILLVQWGEICLFVCSLLFAVLSFWSVQIGKWAWYEDVSIGVLLACLILHVAGQFILNSLKNSGAGSYRYAEYSLLAAFWIFMFTAILRMNRDSLFFASQGSRRTSKSMRVQNAVLSASVAVMAAVISAAAPMHAAVSAFLRLLAKVFFGDSVAEDPAHGGYTTATEAVIPTETVEEVSESSGASLFFDRFLLILTYVLFAVVVILALYLLVRLLVLLSGKLIKWLSRFTEAVSQDYVDEITDIRDESAERRSVFARMRTMMRNTNQHAISGREQIRHRYWVLTHRHPQWDDSSTARENIPEEMAALYEKARYSNHDIGEQEAALFKTGTRKI